MKKVLSIMLMIVCIAAIPWTSTFAAAEGVEGVYDLTVDSGYTFTPLTASGNSISSRIAEVDGKIVTLYENAEKFTLSYSDLESYSDSISKYHLVLMIGGTSSVPTESNIYYIDQTSPVNGQVEFTIYPKQMAKGEYSIYFSKSEGKGLRKVAYFNYTKPYVLGDVNDDGYWTANDALCVLQIAVNRLNISVGGQNMEVTDTMKLSADVNTDGFVTANDALLVLQKAVGRDVF